MAIFMVESDDQPWDGVGYSTRFQTKPHFWEDLWRHVLKVWWFTVVKCWCFVCPRALGPSGTKGLHLSYDAHLTGTLIAPLWRVWWRSFSTSSRILSQSQFFFERNPVLVRIRTASQRQRVILSRSLGRLPSGPGGLCWWETLFCDRRQRRDWESPAGQRSIEVQAPCFAPLGTYSCHVLVGGFKSIFFNHTWDNWLR